MNNQTKKYILVLLPIIILVTIALYSLYSSKKEVTLESPDQSSTLNDTRTFIEDRGSYVFSFKYPENWLPQASYGLFSMVTFMNSNEFDLYTKNVYGTDRRLAESAGLISQNDLSVSLYPSLEYFIKDQTNYEYINSSSTDLESYIMLNTLKDSDNMSSGFRLKDTITVNNKPAYYIEADPNEGGPGYPMEPVKQLLIEENGNIIIISFKDDATAASIIPTLKFFERPNW